MELYDVDSEVQLLRTVTDDKIPKRRRLSLLATVQANHFHHEYTQDAFKRIINLVQTRNHLINWRELIRDPAIDRDARDLFEDSRVRPCKNPKSFKKLLDDVDTYRKRRELFDLANELADEFQDEKGFDSEAALDKISERVNKIRENTTEDETVWNFGLNDNSDEILEMAMNSPKESMLRTGFKEYDDRNGGLPTTGVMIMAGTTSGGKSVISSVLGKNLAELNEGIRVNKTTLEMSQEQEMNRIMAMISGVPFNKIKHRKLSSREKAKIKKDLDTFSKKLKRQKSQFSFVAGTKSRTIEALLSFLTPYAFDVNIIDYISLLDGADGDDQWKQLGTIVRKCKMYSAEHNCLIIILAQLDSDSSKIRYSRAIKEHADVMWKWNYTDEEVRATHVIPMEVDKVRDGELFTMPLAEMFGTMRVGDPEDEDIEAYKEIRQRSGKRGKKRKEPTEDETESSSRRRKRGKSDNKDDDLVLG